MQPRFVRPFALVAFALVLAACGADESGPSAIAVEERAPSTTGVTLAARDDSTTLLRANGRTQVLEGRHEHARLAPEIPSDGLATAAARQVLEDTANHRSRREPLRRRRHDAGDPATGRDPARRLRL